MRTKETKEFCGSRGNIGSHSNRGRNHFAEIHNEGRRSARCVSDSNDNQVRKKMENTVKKFRLSRVAKRFVKEREKKGETLRILLKLDKAVAVRMLCHTSNSEVVQNLRGQTGFACKKAWDLHKNKYKVKQTWFGHVNILPISQQHNSREKCRISGRL